MGVFGGLRPPNTPYLLPRHGKSQRAPKVSTALAWRLIDSGRIPQTQNGGLVFVFGANPQVARQDGPVRADGNLSGAPFDQVGVLAKH